MNTPVSTERFAEAERLFARFALAAMRETQISQSIQETPFESKVALL
jgi:hypothetical protein